MRDMYLEPYSFNSVCKYCIVTVWHDKPWLSHISKHTLYIWTFVFKLNFRLCYSYGQSDYVLSSQTAYRRRFPIWLDKLVAGSAPCLHSNQWCWASVTAHVLFQNEYVNATGCSFSLDGNLALSPWLRPLCAYFMREMVWGVIWKAAVTCWGNEAWACLTNRKGHVCFSLSHLVFSSPPVCPMHSSSHSLDTCYTSQPYTANVKQT